MMEKLGGVSEFKELGRESGESQVSDRDRISRFWSQMKSLRRAGLSSVRVTEVAERMFRCANWSVVDIGPGLRWMSPERKSKR
jgi:hypothetical protein